jgi:hypothetical protein
MVLSQHALNPAARGNPQRQPASSVQMMDAADLPSGRRPRADKDAGRQPGLLSP